MTVADSSRLALRSDPKTLRFHAPIPRLHEAAQADGEGRGAEGKEGRGGGDQESQTDGLRLEVAM
jgi:hypothetical protein